jgi:uncharacterized protein DUF4157
MNGPGQQLVAGMGTIFCFTRKERAMHQSDHDRIEGGSLRPKAGRLEDTADDRMIRAALSGRLDAIGPDGVRGLQRVVGNAATTGALADPELAAEPNRSPVHDVVSSGGEPLSQGVRADMEARLDHDFGDVRVHTDDAADKSARSVNAHAYTVGSHVVFQRSAFDPESHAGATTLAHELTHVVQQRSGPVDGTPAEGGIQISDPADRFEREASETAERVMSTAPPATDSSPHLQRQVGQVPEEETPEEEEAVQGSFLQRQDEGAEEEIAEE